MPSANETVSFRVDEASAEVLERFTSGTGAIIAGRHLFDITNGWGDNHPIGAPVVVVTHRVPDDADRWPRTGLVDDIWVSLIPVLFGAGKPYFTDLGRHVLLEDPEVVPGTRALHLRYPVRRDAASGVRGGRER